jgi:hypothetical protein
MVSLLLLLGVLSRGVLPVLGSQTPISERVLHGFSNTNSRSAKTIGTQPNVVFILTDDQDVHLESLSYMPLLKKHMQDEGTTFTRHYCTVALCCPSRVSLWTGQAAHNTNVTDVKAPYGKIPSQVFHMRAKQGRANSMQVVTPSSSHRATTKIIFPSGSKKPVTTTTTLESCSTAIV